MRYAPRTQSSSSIDSWGRPATPGIGVVDGYGVATGGSSSTITVGGKSYRLLTFTSTGTLTVTASGLFDILVIGGGSSGENSWAGNGRPGSGGGGSGGYMQTSVYFTSTNTHTLTVGAGGAKPAGTMEGPYFGTPSGLHITSTSGVPLVVAVGSASGKGAAPSWSSGYVANHPLFGGKDGGTGGGGGNGGGGGGLGGVGAAVGVGGTGADFSAWLGQSAGTTYLGGGGCGRNSSGTVYAGGAGGGGGNSPGTGVANGGANTGGGGRGGADTDSGAGGSGVVYVRFRI